MAHCMDLDPSVDLEGTKELGKQRDAVPVTAKKDACIQDPEAWTLLGPDAICDGCTKHSIEGTSALSEADMATGNILNLQEEHHMTREEFWSLIDSTLDAEDQEEQFVLICEEVTKLSEAGIVSFDENMRELLHESHIDPLWVASGIIKIGCSDDYMGCSADDSEFEFADFRLWLMSKGRFVFESVLKNPDSLSVVLTQRDIDDEVRFGGLLFIAYQIYKNRTGKELWAELEDGEDFDDAINEETHKQLKEIKNIIDIDEMYKRYPNLMQKFSDRYLRLKASAPNGEKFVFEFKSMEPFESHDLVVV